MFSIPLRNEAATDRLGKTLAQLLPPGAVIALEGTLGAGKTRLVQGVGVAVGIPADAVTSPTFMLIHEYRQGRVPLYHFDAYRLRDEDEFLELGPEEYFDGAGLTFIEWADRVIDCLPPMHWEIEIEVTGEQSRRCRIRTNNTEDDQVLARLEEQLSP
jgi:tRNA threonylcarbamoyladenosine biosynthesis protein TsaE